MYLVIKFFFNSESKSLEAGASFIALNHDMFRRIAHVEFPREGFFSNAKSNVEQKLVEIEGLLAFALTHCTSVHIEDILLQKLCVEKCRERMGRLESELVGGTETQVGFGKVSLDYFDGKDLTDFDVNAIRSYNDKAAFYIRKLLEFKNRESGETDNDSAVLGRTYVSFFVCR